VRASGVTAVNVTVNAVGNGPDRFAKTIAAIAGVEHELNAHPDVFLKILSAKDIAAAKSSNRMGLIFGFQDTSMLEGDLTRLAMFCDLGLRISQPTYNRRNLMGDGCLETADGGLSKLGHEFIAEMNRLHMLLDLSHAAPRTISEGIAASSAKSARRPRWGGRHLFHAVPTRIRATARRGRDPPPGACRERLRRRPRGAWNGWRHIRH